MKWLRMIPRQRTPEVSTQPSPEAVKAVADSSAARAEVETRREHVSSVSSALAYQVERNHLAERLELAMRLKARHP